MRRFLRVLLILAMLGLCMTAEAESAVGLLKIEISRPICGSEPDMPECDIQAREAATQGEPSAWITAWDASGYIPFQGTFEGDETYTAYVTLEARAGYRFDGNTRVAVYDAESMEYVRTEPLLRQPDRIVIVAEVKAEHYWDEDLGSETDATCISPGSVTRVCEVDPSHVMTEVLPIDPEAHDWGEWETVREATRTREGEKRRACALCGRVETEVIGKAKLPYTNVYEPDTSWAMAATVAWRSGPDALATATGSQRPATAIVWLDEKLNVYDRDGSLLSDDLGRYIDATSGGMIPAFYIRDSRTAAALKAFLPESGLLDCFVLSTPDHADLVRDVADLTHVRGMLDYTAISKPDRNALTDMVASTNAAHGKVILLSAEAASRENVRFLQSLASTVWVQTPTDTRTIMTMYTNGVNGVVVDDYEAALRAESFFRDDAPSLLRAPLIIGHRGDPSTYVENTLDSARGAFEEGVDSVENDIQLSADGEVFILHDDTTERLLNFIRRDEEGEIYPAEHFTLKQLQAQPFDWESIINWNEVLPGESSRYGTLYGQEEQKIYRIPTLREYIEAFKGTGLVHDTEIKSYNPAIIPAYKALVDDYDAWDQFFTITFNTQILDAIYSDYPQISIGALNLGEWMDVDSEGLEGTNLTQAKLRGLFEVLDAWNATYNPIYMHSHEEALQAARHRGLTVWPWTYRIDYGAEDFARDYLRGYAGLTCDYPWVASDCIVEIEARDSVVASIEDIPSPTGRTQSGEERVLADAEPVLLEALPEGQSLVLWRYRAELDVNGTGYGHYYLYSKSLVDAFVGGDDEAGAYKAGKFICEQLGGEGEVAVITGLMEQSTGVDRHAGFMRACAEYPNITVVAEQGAEWSSDKAFDVMTNILTAHPDLKGVFACNDQMAVGMVNAAEAAGKAPEDLVLVGYDGILDAVNMILEGRLDALVSLPNLDEGAMGVKLAVALAQNPEYHYDREILYDCTLVTDGFIEGLTDQTIYEYAAERFPLRGITEKGY